MGRAGGEEIGTDDGNVLWLQSQTSSTAVPYYIVSLLPTWPLAYSIKARAFLG